MSQQALRMTLQMLDCPSSSLIGHDDVAAWAKDDLAALVAAGLLTEADFAGEVECECDAGGLEEAMLVDDDDGGEPAAYIVCHEGGLGRIRVPLERLRRWALSPAGLAAWLAVQLQAGAVAEECAADRLWWAGRPNLGHKSADVFLARGAAWADAVGVFGKAPRLAECARPLVLVPCDAPKSSPFVPEAAVLSLSRLLRLEDGCLSLDIPGIAEASGGRRAAGLRVLVPFPTPPGTTWDQVTIQVFKGGNVVISAPGVQETRNYQELGFTDRRSGKPDASWALLLVIARQGGSLSWDDAIARDELLKRKKLVSNLRKALKAAFGLKPDPIPYNRQAHAYEVKFIIHDKRRTPR